MEINIKNKILTSEYETGNTVGIWNRTPPPLLCTGGYQVTTRVTRHVTGYTLISVLW